MTKELFKLTFTLGDLVQDVRDGHGSVFPGVWRQEDTAHYSAVLGLTDTLFAFAPPPNQAFFVV